jgi:hypothetical protein
LSDCNFTLCSLLLPSKFQSQTAFLVNCDLQQQRIEHPNPNPNLNPSLSLQ